MIRFIKEAGSTGVIRGHKMPAGFGDEEGVPGGDGSGSGRISVSWEVAEKKSR